jgi:hypothetical protein
VALELRLERELTDERRKYEAQTRHDSHAITKQRRP